jgi:flagellar export protein FliJ
MPFRFQLDAVLRFREGVERTEEAALHRIVQEIADVERQLQEIDLRQVHLREQREHDLVQKLPALHLMEIVEQEEMLNKTVDELRLRLQQLHTQRIEQLAVYQAAHQDRQVLSELREQQQRAYALNQNRQEQKMLDDIFLARWKDGD